MSVLRTGLIGLGMMVPKVMEILERPFARFQRFGGSKNPSNGFLLGLVLGAAYVPCAGPVLAAVAVAGATGRIGADTVALAVSFAVGTAIPLLAFALVIAAALAWAVLVYIGVDFGFWGKVLDMSNNAERVWRAAGEAILAATLLVFLFAYLNLSRWHVRYSHITIGWLVFLGSLVALALFDPAVASGIARMSLVMIAFAGFALIVYLSTHGFDRAVLLIPTWFLLVVWVVAAGMTVAGSVTNDIVGPALLGGLVLIVMLIGFTVMQHAFAGGGATTGVVSDVERRALALTGSGDLIWDWDVSADKVFTSPETEALLGLKRGTLEGPAAKWLEVLHPLDQDRFRAAVADALDRLLAEHRDLARDVHPLTAPLVDAIADLTAGGKRLRPMLEKGAHVYVCGNKAHLEEAVAQAFDTLMANSDRLPAHDRWWKLMQREGLIDRGRLPHDVDRAVHRLLAQLQRKSGFCGDPARQRQRERREIAARHHMVDHAEAMCLVGAPDIGSEQHLLGLARTEFPGMHEPFDAADAHRHNGIAELGVMARDDQVAGPGQHQPAGNALAVDFRDRRFCQIAPAPCDLQVDLLLARETAVGIGFGEAAPISDWREIDARLVLAGRPQIVTGREMRAIAGEDDDLDRIVLHRLVEGGVEVVGHLQVLGVARLRAVHHDPRNRRVGPLDNDRLELFRYQWILPGSIFPP